MLLSDKKLSPEPSMDEILASIRRIIAEDEHATVRPLQRLRGNGDILDLTEAIDESGAVRHITPITLVTPQTQSPALPDGRIEPAPPRPEGAEPRLVSDVASDAVAASFARLASTARHDEAERPLEDIVRETLRPLLQAWLDEHLPELVERLVRAEIARVVGAIRPSAP
jgi:uncharacterized protein